MHIGRAAAAPAVIVAALAVACTRGDGVGRLQGSDTPGVPGGRTVPEDRDAGPGAGVENVVPPGVTRPTGGTFTAPPSIPADCSVDVTPQLGEWVSSAPDNSVLSFPKDACYRLDGTLAVQDRRDLLLDGNGATLKATTEGDRTRSHLRIRRSSNITVQGLVIRGANAKAGSGAEAYRPEREAQHAFELGRVDGLLLDGVQAYDVFGDFVYIGGQTPSRRVTVRNSHFERNGRQGIAVTNGEDVLIQGNHIANVARSLFDLEPNTTEGRALRVQLLANRTGPVGNFWLASKGVGDQVGQVTARGNVMDAPSGGLVWVRTPARLGPRKGFVIDGNTFVARNDVSDEGSRGAFFFENCTDITITANRVEFDLPVPAVELRSSTRVEIRGNQFNGSSRSVVADAASTDVHRG